LQYKIFSLDEMSGIVLPLDIHGTVYKFVCYQCYKLVTSTHHWNVVTVSSNHLAGSPEYDDRRHDTQHWTIHCESDQTLSLVSNRSELR
jgi:hypothetical protein